MKTIIYLLQVSACTGIFYIFYHIVLRRLTFFTINRWYLFGSLVLSFIIPSITIPAESIPQTYSFNPASFSTIKEIYIPSVQTNVSFPVQAVNKPVTEEYFDWIKTLLFLYFLIVGVLMAYLLISIEQLYIGLKGVQLARMANVKVLKSTRNFKNSSFLNYIFINDEELTTKEIGQVIAHELVHIEQFHSVDKIIARLAEIVLWFNPFVYAYANAIEANHEYEVDFKVSANSDKEAYINLLLRLANPANCLLGHRFSKLPLSRRIAMLFGKRSKSIKKVVYVLILPLIAISCVAFTNRGLKAAAVVNYSKNIAKGISKGFPVNTVKEIQKAVNKTKDSQEPVVTVLAQPAVEDLQDSTDVVVPTTFTPDGDGVNDLLVISVNEGAKMKSFKIIRKNPLGGQNPVIFEASDLTHFWDGTEGNIMVPEGNYAWSFEGEDKSNKTLNKTGIVTLSRTTPQDSLLVGVTYSANSIAYNPQTKVLRLYGTAKLNYKNIQVKAEYIEVNLKTSIIFGQKGGYTARFRSVANAGYFKVDPE
jgi:hypothetical protein